MLVIYLQDKDGNNITQVFNAYGFKCTQRLSDYSEAEFTLSNDNPALSYSNFQEFNRCRITREIDGVVQEYIDGYVKVGEAGVNETTIVVRSWEHFLARKVVNSSKNYSSQSIQAIVNDFIGDINTREALPFSVSSNCSATTIDFEIPKNTNALNALKSLASRGFQFVIKDKELIVKEEVGEDRTAGSNYYLLKRRYDEPGDRNVRDRNVVYDADTIANAVTEKSTGFTTDAGSIATFGRIEENIVVDGGVASSISSVLDARKGSVKQVEIEPDVEDFFYSSIGDKVQAEIDGGNDIAKYTGPVYVLEKIVSGQDLKNVRSKVSSGTVYTPTLLETIKEYNARIARLELL